MSRHRLVRFRCPISVSIACGAPLSKKAVCTADIQSKHKRRLSSELAYTAESRHHFPSQFTFLETKHLLHESHTNEHCMRLHRCLSLKHTRRPIEPCYTKISNWTGSRTRSIAASATPRQQLREMGRKDAANKPAYSLKVPKGTKDWDGADMVIREKIFSTITEVFKRHGAVTIDT